MADRSTGTGAERGILLFYIGHLVLYFSLETITYLLYKNLPFPCGTTGRKSTKIAMEALMSNGDGVHWQCPNRDCNWSMVAANAGEGGEVPRCACGSKMKKSEAMPVYRYLDFLRARAENKEEVGIERE
jgi:hypothetical protein